VAAAELIAQWLAKEFSPRSTTGPDPGQKSSSK
jgi:hypothetical protein